MRNLKKTTMVLGGLVAMSAMASAFVIGCSGDDTSLVAADAGQDQTTDVVASETSVVDAGGSDAKDAGIDVQAAIQAFPGAIADAICGRLRTCCNMTAATFNMELCTDRFPNGYSFEGNTVGLEKPGVLDGGRLIYNQAAADDCIARLKNLTCTVTTATEHKATTTQCYAAITGTIPSSGTGCRAAVECAPGNYCSLGDAGVGTCLPIRALGALCEDVANSEACSYRGEDQICDPTAADGGACIALRSNGVPCLVSNRECSSGLCDDNSLCGNTQTVLAPGDCDLFLRDAGAD